MTDPIKPGDILSVPPVPNPFKPDIPTEGIYDTEVLIPMVRKMLENLEIGNMDLTQAFNHYNRCDSSILLDVILFNTCLKQQERIDVLEQSVETLEGMLLP